MSSICTYFIILPFACHASSQTEESLSKEALLISSKVHSLIFQDDFDINIYENRIDEMSGEIRKSIAGIEDPKAILEEINEYLFVKEGFEADIKDIDGTKIENMLLNSVLDNKKGACMALSVLYKSITDKLGLPVYGVAAPSHFFLRFQDDKVSINIEVLDKGRLHFDDKYFKDKYFVYDNEPFYLYNLNKRKTLAAYMTNLGSILTRYNKTDSAIALLDEAREINPEDVEVMTNLGIAYSQKGDLDAAIKIWEKAVIHDSYDDKAHYNLGVTYFKKKNYEKSIEHYDKSLILGHDVNIKLLRALEPFRKDSYFWREKPDDGEEI